MKVDAANGMADEKLVLLNSLLRGLLVIKLYNDGSQGKLNYMVGMKFQADTCIIRFGVFWMV